MNTNNVITFEDSASDLLTGMLKTGVRKLIKLAGAMAFAELLKSLQGVVWQMINQVSYARSARLNQLLPLSVIGLGVPAGA